MFTVSSDLLHAHLRRHEKREKQITRDGGRRTPSGSTRNMRRSPVPQGFRQQRSARHSVPSPYDSLERLWPTSGEETTMLDGYAVDQMSGGNSHNLQPSLSAFPLSSLGAMATSQQMLSSNGIWHESVIQNCELASNTEIHWPFQDGGIFGLPSEAYPDLSPNEYLDPIRDNYSHLQDHGRLHNLEFVCTPDLDIFHSDF
jgi:hypothetical protein